LNIARLWKFAQDDLGGILTGGFFLNSSRLLKDLKKMNYAVYYLFKMQPNALLI
jgi:hypothetical protein